MKMKLFEPDEAPDRGEDPHTVPIRFNESKLGEDELSVRDLTEDDNRGVDLNLEPEYRARSQILDNDDELQGTERQEFWTQQRQNT